MEKLAIIVLLMLTSNYSFAQYSIGGGLAYGIGSQRPGLSLKTARKLCNERWEVAADFTYYTTDNFVHEVPVLPLKNVNELYTLNLDFHYRIGLKNSKKAKCLYDYRCEFCICCIQC